MSDVFQIARCPDTGENQIVRDIRRSRKWRWCRTRELDALDLLETVFLSQMTINAHREGTAVLMAEPTAHRRNVHAAFNARCREKMAHRVMSEVREAKLPTRRRETLLCALNWHDAIGGFWLPLRVKAGE